ncbi:MAG: ROK family protein, partial [Chitinivibrionales bacterium]|nr:ROK family protein [Chitinivibrionales bacterium]
MPKNDKKKYWIGFDLGGTKMAACLFNEDFKIVAREKKKTKAADGVEAGLERITALLQTVLDAAKVGKDELAGIGCGCAGPVDHVNGIIATAPNLGWSGVKLRKKLENAFECPVTVINDGDAGVYAEFRRGAARGKESVLGVFPGTGVGGGYIYNGQSVRTNTISCFELGHIPLVPGGLRCGCGQRG